MPSTLHNNNFKTIQREMPRNVVVFFSFSLAVDMHINFPTNFIFRAFHQNASEEETPIKDLCKS